MRVSKRFPMAVHSLLFVAVLSPRQRVTSSLIADSIGSNPVTIRNLFRDLSAHGLLKASIGKNGGIRLGRDVNHITLWDIYEAVETDEAKEIFKIYEGNSQCPVGKNLSLILYPHMVSAIEAMKSEMEKVTIQTLMTELKEKYQ